MANKKPKQYCTNKDLMRELRVYHETDVISEELGKMFLEIATRFTNRGNWVGYPQAVKEDFIGEACLRMISQIHKFDINREKPNPFAYFTQICFHKYIMEAKKYYKHINIQRDVCKKYLEEIECNEHMDDGFLKKILKERVDDLG